MQLAVVVVRFAGFASDRQEHRSVTETAWAVSTIGVSLVGLVQLGYSVDRVIWTDGTSAVGCAVSR